MLLRKPALLVTSLAGITLITGALWAFGSKVFVAQCGTSPTRTLFAWTDYDGDGVQDAYVLLPSGHGGLLRGVGDGTLRDVTRQVGLTRAGLASRATWVDIDQDGDADLTLWSRQDGTRIFDNAGSGQFNLRQDDPGVRAQRNGTVSGKPGRVPKGRRSASVPAFSSNPHPQESATGTGKAGVQTFAEISPVCTEEIRDQATGACLQASSVPMLGLLYPLSNDLFVASTGEVVINGTLAKARLTVSGTDGASSNPGTAASFVGGSASFSSGQTGALGLSSRGGIGDPTGGDGAHLTGGNPLFDFAGYGGRGAVISGGFGGDLGTGGVGAQIDGGEGGSPGTNGTGGTGLIVNGGDGNGSFGAGGQAAIFTGGSPGGAGISVQAATGYFGGPGAVIHGGDGITPGVGVLATGGAGSGPGAHGGDFTGGLGYGGGHGVLAQGGDSGGLDDAGAGLFATGGKVLNAGFLDGDGVVGTAGGPSGVGVRAVPNGGAALVTEGDVGIATNSPTFTLEVNGTAGKPGGGSWSVSSDRRLKRNIRTLDNALETLLALRGVCFEYKDPASIGELSGERMGFIAQEVEPVLADWVDEGPDGMKRLTIRGFEALAVEALRELSTANAELREANAVLRARIDALETRVAGAH